MKKIILLFVVAFCTVISNAQVNYTFSAATATYTSIVGGISPTLLATTSGGTTGEGYANNLPIGFTLNYNGTNYTAIGVCTNGFAYLGTVGLSSSSATYNNNIATGFNSDVRPILAPLWDDLDVQSSTNIKYITTGTAPNRIFTLEWANVLWDEYSASAAISFQLKLYEGTNNIEFIYRQEAGNIENGGAGLGASIGITSNSTGLANYLSLNNSSSSPTASSTIATNNIVTKPATGQVYRFSPLIPCSGTPLGGTPVATVTTTCANTNFNISLTGQTVAGGISYQWQKSLAGQNVWANISGATDATLTTSQTASTDYRCVVACTNSSISSNSTVVNVGLLTGISCSITNDDCSVATTVVQNNYDASCTGTLFNTSVATQSSTASTFFTTSQDDDIWYKFVATANIVVIRFNNLAAVAGAQGNMLFSISSGSSCSSLTELGGRTVTITGNAGEALYSGLTVGTTYYVRVATSGTTWRASGNICILQPQISEGTSNSCLPLFAETVTSTNSNNWIGIVDGSKVVAEINPQGNVLGAISAKLYKSTSLRQFSTNGRYYLSRNIEISPATQPSSGVMVRLYLTNAEITELAAQATSSVTGLNDLFVTKNSDICSGIFGGGGTFITPSARVNYGTNGAYMEFTVSSFSSFYIHGGLGALPVSITEFTGERRGTENILQWKTENEINNAGFELQRSTDGFNFTTLQFISTLSTTGTSSTLLSYQCIDKKPLYGNNYYRLVQKDKDGKLNYSTTVLIKAVKATAVYISNPYPNPASDYLTIVATSPKKINTHLIVNDITGKTVMLKNYTLIAGDNTLQLNINNLSKGIYTCKIVDENGDASTVQRIVKQ